MDNIELERMLAASRASTSNVPISPQEGRNSLGVQYLMKSLSLGNGNPDMKEMNAYARDRARQGDADQLNSVLSGIAGPRHSQARDMYLKRALSAQNPIEVSGGMLTEDGFVKDPYAARERERKSNYEVGTQLLDQETKAQDRRSAISPYFTALPSANGYVAFNSRDSSTSPLLDVNKQPIVRANDSPSLQGDIAGSKQTGKNNADRIKTAEDQLKRTNQLLGTLNTAETLLNTDPTHSDIGNLIDKSGQIIGYAPTSAVTAQKLEVLGGWLTSNVPRMEGPQSDKDTAQYKLMAGSVGDRTIPIETRLGAIKVLKDLQEKYKDSQLDIVGNENTSPSTSRASNAAPAGQEFAPMPPGAVRRVVKP